MQNIYLIRDNLAMEADRVFLAPNHEKALSIVSSTINQERIAFERGKTEFLPNYEDYSLIFVCTFNSDLSVTQDSFSPLNVKLSELDTLLTTIKSVK